MSMSFQMNLQKRNSDHKSNLQYNTDYIANCKRAPNRQETPQIDL